MFENVPARFVPEPEQRADLIFANEDLGYVYNKDSLNAAYEILERGIDENGWGDRTALVCPDSDEELTYEELRSRVNRFAGVLRNLDVEPGDRVVWRFGEVPEAAVAMFAIWKVGAVNISSVLIEGEKELSHFINDTEAKVFVSAADLWERAESVIEDAPSVENVVVAGDESHGYHSYENLMAEATPYEDHHDTEPFDVATILYTGGTTGLPKGCIHSHATEIATTDLVGGRERGYSPDDVVLSQPPVGHGFGGGEKIQHPFRFGAKSILLQRPEPVEVLEAYDEYDVTATAMFDTVVKMALPEVDLAGLDLSSLRIMDILGSLDEDEIATLEEATGTKPSNPFGMAPMRHIFMSPIRGGENMGAPTRSLGKPFHGYEAKVVDPDEPHPDNELGRGEIGRMAVRGPSGTCYWHNNHPKIEERQERDTAEGWAIHDDAISRDEDGNFYYHGRLDDMIATGGRQVAPGEVEDVLIEFEKISDIAVVGQPDDVYNEIVKAFVVLAAGVEWTDEVKQEIKAYAKDNMAMYKYPREIVFTDELPRDEVGKIQYQELRGES